MGRKWEQAQVQHESRQCRDVVLCGLWFVQGGQVLDAKLLCRAPNRQRNDVIRRVNVGPVINSQVTTVCSTHFQIEERSSHDCILVGYLPSTRLASLSEVKNGHETEDRQSSATAAGHSHVILDFIHFFSSCELSPAGACLNLAVNRPAR